MAAKTPTQNPTHIYCTVAFIHGHKDFVPCGPWCVAVFRSAQIERRVNLAATRSSLRGLGSTFPCSMASYRGRSSWGRARA